MSSQGLEGKEEIKLFSSKVLYRKLGEKERLVLTLIPNTTAFQNECVICIERDNLFCESLNATEFNNRFYCFFKVQ